MRTIPPRVLPFRQYERRFFFLLDVSTLTISVKHLLTSFEVIEKTFSTAQLGSIRLLSLLLLYWLKAGRAIPA